MGNCRVRPDAFSTLTSTRLAVNGAVNVPCSECVRHARPTREVRHRHRRNQPPVEFRVILHRAATRRRRQSAIRDSWSRTPDFSASPAIGDKMVSSHNAGTSNEPPWLGHRRTEAIGVDAKRAAPVLKPTRPFQAAEPISWVRQPFICHRRWVASICTSVDSAIGLVLTASSPPVLTYLFGLEALPLGVRWTPKFRPVAKL